jgi:DNA-binding protein YbaB
VNGFLPLNQRNFLYEISILFLQSSIYTFNSSIILLVYLEVFGILKTLSFFIMVSFSQARDLFKMQREAKRIKKELKAIHVEAESQGVVVTVSAEQEVVSITIPDGLSTAAIANAVQDATNRAMKKAQLVAAEKMQGIMGSMGFPTDGGMRGMSQ